MSRVVSILFAAYFFTTSMFFVLGSALVCALVAPFDPNRKLVHLYTGLWANFYLVTNPFWKLTFEGRENLDAKQVYVLVANHQSYADIIVLFLLYFPFKWVSKDSIFRVPAIGWNMQLNQYVGLARGNLASIKEMMAICRNWLKRGSSIMMFPEGTRSANGELQPFRDGAFRLAIDCGLPLVPIVIDGTHEILPKGGKTVNLKGQVRVKILPPVYADSFERSSAKMRDHVYSLMKETLAGMRAPRPSESSCKPAVAQR